MYVWVWGVGLGCVWCEFRVGGECVERVGRVAWSVCVDGVHIMG